VIANPQNDFELIENAIAAQLEAQAEFSGLKAPDGTDWHVLTEDEGEIQFLFRTMIDVCGLAIIVRAPTGECSERMGNIPGPVFDPLRCVVQVSEAVTFNRSGSGTNIHAETAASLVRRSLHLFHPAGIPGLNTVLRCVKAENRPELNVDTGALTATRLLTFETRLIEASKTIQ
jgi:hypothetical protein